MLMSPYGSVGRGGVDVADAINETVRVIKEGYAVWRGESSKKAQLKKEVAELMELTANQKVLTGLFELGKAIRWSGRDDFEYRSLDLGVFQGTESIKLIISRENSHYDRYFSAVYGEVVLPGEVRTMGRQYFKDLLADELAEMGYELMGEEMGFRGDVSLVLWRFLGQYGLSGEMPILKTNWAEKAILIKEAILKKYAS